MAIFVCPRWPSAAILDFIEPQIASLDPPTPKNPGLEPNMEWIGCTVCDIFAFKLYCDLETGVRGHSRSSKVALFDRANTTLYSSSIVNMPLSIQRRRQVWSLRRGPGEFVISGCLAPTPTPCTKKNSPDFYVSYGPIWAAQGVPDPRTSLASYATVSITVSEIKPHIGRKSLPLCIRRPH